MTKRREEATRRDEILCSLAHQLPDSDRNSPVALARWLKQLQERHFGGLSTWIPDNDERQAFEYWIKQASEGNIAKRVQRAFRDEQEAKKPKSTAPPPPPLVWPLGMRQRKDRDSKFKLPWLLADTSGSEKVFLECLGDRTLLEVSVALEGKRVGYMPALRPGSFIEVEWERNPEVARIVTWGGNRDHILNYESMKDMAEHTTKMSASPSYDMMKPIVEWSKQCVSSIERVLPRDLEAWKHTVRRFSLSVTYCLENGNATGGLKGVLSMDMERLWFLFSDDRGNDTPVR